MKLVHSKKLTLSEKVAKYKAKSSLEIWFLEGKEKPNDWSMRITFGGLLSHIPAIKNSKIPGTNFINPSAKAKLRAMDELYHEVSGAEFKHLFFEEPISLILLPSERLRRTDPLSALESLADWLEPATKRVGKSKHYRGWGIGLVANDSLVIPYCCPFIADGIERKKTDILIRPWRLVREAGLTFVAAHYF